jgi:translation initiation factor IF-3
MHCKSAKEIWDKLEVLYEGYSKVKEAKLKTFRTQFENLKMKEEENIVEYFHRVDEVVNSIKVEGEEMTEKPISQNILRSLPMIYDANIYTIEDSKKLDKLTVDHLHGIFIVYEMRTSNEKP